MADNIQATPRNYLGGLLSDAYRYMQSPERTQQMQGFAGLLGTTGLPQTIERMAYGEPLTNMGRANVPLLKPETADAMMTVAPMVGPALRGAGRASMAAGRAGERYAERVVPQVMERGGLPAQLLSDLGQGSRSQMYIGAESPMYNKEAAFKAAQMLKKGTTPQEVWRQTNTGRYGNDFIQEISDKRSQISGPQRTVEGAISEYGNTLGDVLEHPELGRAYPDIRKIQVSAPELMDAKASYGTYTAKPTLDEILSTESLLDMPASKTKELIKVKQGIEDQKSSLLHEVQHAIQGREGWSKGGNADEFARELIKERDALNAKITDLNEKMRGAVGTPAYEDLMSQRIDTVNELLSKKLNDPVDLLEQAQKRYEALAGEAMARSTQSRINLTPEERLQYYPFEQQSTSNPYGLDVDPNKLVFRGGLLD
jgi:hypothetical protein